MNQVVRALVASVLRGLLPYPDPVRRRRVRKAARRLVVCEPWPADDAITGRDAAQLALLRLLWLQRQTRRAARGRHREAAVLLARSSLEACILGLYCLHSQDAVARLRAANLRAGAEVLAFLVADGLIPQDVIDRAVAAFGTPGRSANVKDMAQLVDIETGGTAVVGLYRRLYVPTSTFFVHANAASLLRHVTADNTLSDRPMVPWARRSTVRLADACVGVLAAAIAHRNGSPNGLFFTYAEAHIARVMTPLMVVTGKGLSRIKPAQILEVIRTARHLRRYLSGQASSDPIQAREARIRADYNVFAAAMVGPDVPSEAVETLVDYFTEKILADLAVPVDDQTIGQDEQQDVSTA